MNVLKRFLFSAAALAVCGIANAVIANPEPVKVIQPDGSEVTLVLHGDEHFSYTTTSAGYTVVRNLETKAWEYAALNADGELVPTGETATDGMMTRTGVKHLKPVVAEETKAEQQRSRRNVLSTGNYDYSKFRGLVILVEYNDAPFSRDDYSELMHNMVNQRGYTGYMSNHMLPSKIECTGSVRDYYFENSNGIFDPGFDVVGPVKIDYSQYYARKSSGVQALVEAALKAADELVNYKDYDSDGNRQVDMVYFIFSGAGSNYSGNDERLIWPHASQVMNVSLDGVSFGRYACSTELYGQPANKLLDGIGTICHEFSHVLGLPDLYDVDYETGGQAIHPAKWSIMASGSYLDKSKTPCGYSLFERYLLGFAQPVWVENPGTYTFRPLSATDKPEGLVINSAIPDEYFAFEARVKERWDAFLPGEGMLAYRIDYTNPSIWSNNRVNALAARTYYELLRAMPKRSSSGVTDSAGDPFPGTGDVHVLDNNSSPSLRSWTTTSTPLVLSNIDQNEDGSITVTVIRDDSPTFIEDFSTMERTEADTLNVEGRFTTWSFTQGARVAIGEDMNHYASTVKNSVVKCDPFDGKVETCAITIANPTTQNAIFRFHYSVDNGATWVALSNLDGTASPTVNRGTETIIHYAINNVEKAIYRLTQYSGNATTACQVKRFEFGVRGGTTSGVNEATKDNATDAEDAIYFNLQGMRVAKPETPGVYIVRQGERIRKVVIR